MCLQFLAFRVMQDREKLVPNIHSNPARSHRSLLEIKAVRERRAAVSSLIVCSMFITQPRFLIILQF